MLPVDEAQLIKGFVINKFAVTYHCLHRVFKKSRNEHNGKVLELYHGFKMQESCLLKMQ